MGPAEEIDHWWVGFLPGASDGREGTGWCAGSCVDYVYISSTWAAKAAGADFSVGMSFSLYRSLGVFIMVAQGFQTGYGRDRADLACERATLSNTAVSSHCRHDGVQSLRNIVCKLHQDRY